MNKHIFAAMSCLVLGLLVGQHRLFDINASAQASAQGSGQAPPARDCDYTFVGDSGEPNIGKDGRVEYSDSWANVLDAGWRLKTSHAVGSTGVYMFEKCR